MPASAVRVNQRAAGIRIERAVLPPHEIKHELDVTVELHAEPVPADLIVRKLIAAELVIHPALPRERFAIPGDLDLSFGFEPCERIIIGRTSGPFTLLAEPLIAVKNRRLLRRQTESQRY